MTTTATYGTLSASEHSTQLRKAVIASTVGTAIEWYDFFLYGTAAGLIFGKLFFPNSDPLTATLAAFATLFHIGLSLDVPVAVLAAIPFAVISSAVAIPAAHGLPAQPREFVIYESSLSDIFGVLVFYAWLNAEGSLELFAFDLLGGGGVSLAAAAAVALLLYYFMNQLEGHVRFLPLIGVLIYMITRPPEGEGVMGAPRTT